MSRYDLRVLQWSWGLRVDLGLSYRTAASVPSAAHLVGSRAWLVIDAVVDVRPGDVQQLLTGLRRVAPRFRTGSASDGDELIFVVDHLWYPLTDFQEDAIELAVAGWAAEVLAIQGDVAAVSFDRPSNRYVIEFDEGMWQAG